MTGYIVYKIVINDIVRYIGHTNNIPRREKEHNYSFKKGFKKDLYNFIRAESTITNFDGYIITLIPIKEFKKKVDAKRYEMYLILDDYFNQKILKQKVPNISDR